MNTWRAAIMGVGVWLASGLALAQGDSPVGRWQTISDETGKAESVVEITQNGSEYVGHIVQLLTGDPVRVCEHCKDERKDKPLVGMLLMDGFHADGEQFTGGHIVDPHSGTIYRCRMRLIDGGHRLEVRGFVGIALLGRTQTWVREDAR
ncbi:MAG: DUF2147 domain-containing protein [Pseudomonadota bacterium]|nr:DUF2147 domain-containing protein [Pseudomonadota bacterium]